MSFRQTTQLTLRPRSTSVEPSQQRLADDITMLFRATNALVGAIDSLNLRRVDVPATSTAAGELGDFAMDATHLYLCVSANSWRRIALSTF